MKKVYVIPTTVKVEIKSQSLLIGASQSQAAGNATVLSRRNDNSWDEDDDY